MPSRSSRRACCSGALRSASNELRSDLTAARRSLVTPERWSTLCQSLEATSLASHRAEVMQWPAEVRRIKADSPWLRGVFEGVFDPRLELVGFATIEQRLQGRLPYEH